MCKIYIIILDLDAYITLYQWHSCPLLKFLFLEQSSQEEIHLFIVIGAYHSSGLNSLAL